MENEIKYALNVVYNKPYYNSAKNTYDNNVIVTTLQFIKHKDVKKAYDDLIRKGFIEFNTIYGQVAFTVNSVELVKVDLVKADQERKKEEEDGHGGIIEGVEQHASDERSDDQDVSQDIEPLLVEESEAEHHETE